MGHHLFTLDLSYNALVDIPKDALRHLAALEWLNLQGNQIAEVTRDDWNGLRDTLMSLFLAENNIDYVPPHSLTDFRKLLWLNLDDNNMNRLERDSLSRSINTLSLNHNLITSFPSDIVSEFKDLTWLYLRGNLIDRLPDRGFVFPKTIDKLDLGENFISFIPDHLFNSTLSVRDLHFDFNLLTEIQPNAFQGLNPSRLYLSANAIYNITDRAFLGGPEETLVMLDLEKNNLGGVPKALSFLKSLRYLYLPGNQITEIQRDAFKGSCHKLEALSLSGNFLNSIPRVALENCSMINHLNLGHNRIEQIDPEDFSTWGDNLETLVLRNNRLSSIPANAFRHTPRMRELSLSFNRIVDVNQDSFIDILASLEILEISFGFYRDDFPVTVFKPLTSLQWIALDNNNFRTIAETALYSFGELSYFNMDSNRLTRIPKTLFHQNVHKKLVDIRMANNFIEELGTHTFHNLEALRTIVLTGNKIRKVKFEAFKNLPTVNTIAISSNQISEIEFQAFSGLTSLVELELQQNRLTTFSLNNFANFSTNQSPLSLNLSHNVLVELHPGSVGLFAMKSLDISHNHLKQVPVNFLHIFMQFLEKLDISYNRITKLDTSAFGPLEQLQLLMLQHNNIQQIRPGAFNNLQNVQLVDLSHNHLQALPHMCFSDMLALRKVDFSHNHLRALPPSVFTGTSVESLNFAYNEFVSLPTAALSIVESTLHYLDISRNHLEHLDSTMFNSFSNLIELNIASNKLTILPDNVFVNLRNLISLDISENTVRANFKELFHYTQNVQKLNLAKIGFTSSPTIPLPNLVYLNISHNGISDIEVHSVVSLRQLRTLDLSYNQITHVRSRIWPYLPYLKRLDLSGNPIQSLTKDSFVGASRIETLILKDLNEIMRFDYDTLSHMGYLKELFMNTFPNIEKYRFRVGQLLATVHTLRTLHLEVREDALTDQLSGAFGPKLKELHISGANLKAVDSKTFKGFQNKHELLLSITDTGIETLPDGLLTHLSDVAYLSLDLRRNKLKFLNSQVLYGNKSDWESRGTTFVAGGLALQGNEWTCDCSLVWLGRWLRRWLRETLQIHTAVLKKAQQVSLIINLVFVHAKP
ncbi:hypothetical protein HAZT_HAZT004559 [Hyalella azteca]|uniref:Chaoptin n=1 Tax=Hyalella azteca TaxID=294128 RepID=A0A6A0H5L5_HYAAZ|nr:hypothetical protein HAZT_HAZT004559 [Hyalella azteca]